MINNFAIYRYLQKDNIVSPNKKKLLWKIVKNKIGNVDKIRNRSYIHTVLNKPDLISEYLNAFKH
jgi:hypothetical protein